MKKKNKIEKRKTGQIKIIHVSIWTSVNEGLDIFTNLLELFPEGSFLCVKGVWRKQLVVLSMMRVMRVISCWGQQTTGQLYILHTFRSLQFSSCCAPQRHTTCQLNRKKKQIVFLFLLNFVEKGIKNVFFSGFFLFFSGFFMYILLHALRESASWCEL